MDYSKAQLNGTAPGSAALAVLTALEAAGLEAWIVGGWVRDALMGRPAHDVDMCCSGTWQRNEAALAAAGIPVVESGVKFGGITAVVGGERIEVTTYRIDGFYTDGRHPEEIRPADSVEEDLARRDFTVNAMAWHPARGLLDRYDGEGDIARRQIRTVGDPRQRFAEDALRILRAVRFACRLGFAVEPDTAAALAALAPTLDAVARERVGEELSGILLTCRAGRAMLAYPEVFCAAVPELGACRGFDQHSRFHIYDVYEHIAHVLDAADHETDAARPAPSLLWAAFLHDIGKPACFTLDERGNGHFYGHPDAGAEMVPRIMHRLARPERLIHEVQLLVKYHDRPMEPTRRDVLNMMHRLSGGGLDAVRLIDELFDLRIADCRGKAPGCLGYIDTIERMRSIAHGCVTAGDPYALKMLAITGRDLIAAGVVPGRAIGELLNRALAGAMAGRVANERAALLAYVGLGDDGASGAAADSGR